MMVFDITDGNGGMIAGSCPNRAESAAMSTTSRSLILVNFFPDSPDFTKACKHNSAPLISMVNTCYQAAGKRWPNFIAVDFYKVCICICICICLSSKRKKIYHEMIPWYEAQTCELPEPSATPASRPAHESSSAYTNRRFIQLWRLLGAALYSKCFREFVQNSIESGYTFTFT
ncbi:hypothetical protein ACOSQ2_005525 [Xanthoceras sorbifolium]